MTGGPGPEGPLRRRRVVVTRSEQQSEALGRRLRALGAEPIVFPVIRFEPLPAAELDQLVSDGLSVLDWLVLTSVNAVELLFERLPPRCELPRIAVVGEATERALRERGAAPDVVPEAFRAEELVERLVREDGTLQDRRILLPRSRRGRPEIVRGLEERGATVHDVALYDTLRVDPTPEALDELRRGFDAVTFTSPSSVRNFLAIADAADLDRSRIDATVVACIGPVTAAEARAHGLHPEVVPERYTVTHLVEALAEWFAGDVTGETERLP